MAEAEPAAVPLLRLKKVWRSYPSGDEPIHALKNINLTIEAGEMVGVGTHGYCRFTGMMT